MKLVSSRRRFAAAMYVLASLIVALFSNQAQAVNEYFDVNGTGLGSGATTAGPFTWEGNNWNTDSTGVAAPAAWSDAGNFPIFAAGSDAAATNYTVNVASNHTIAGMALATNGGGTVLVAPAGGTLNLFSNVAGQGFFVGGVSTQNLKISAPIGGDNVTPLVWGGLFGGTASGSLYLYGNNTFQGGVTLNTSAGVNINNANSFGNGGTVKWGGATSVIAVPNNNGVFGGGDATSGFTIANPMLTRSASSLIFVSSTAAPVNWSGAWTLATGVSTLTTNTASTNLTISGLITGTDATSAFTKGGTTATATLTLSNTANSYQGATSVLGGILSVPTIGNTGSNSSLGQNSTINLGNTTTAATLLYTGTGETSNKVVNLAGTTGGATIDQSGTGALKITGNMTATGAGIKTLTLQGSTAGTGEIAGAIVDNSGTNKTSVTKAGTGTWTLSGTNTYTGTTAVNAGTLVMGSAGAVPGANALTLGGGTLSNATGATKTITGATTLSTNSTLLENSAGQNFTFSGSFTNSGGNRVLTTGNGVGTAGGNVTLSGNVFLSEATGTGRTLILAGGGTSIPNYVVSGNVQNFNGGAGTAGSIQVGNGTAATAATLTLTGTNTHSGATNVSTGSTLNIGSAGALGTSTLTFTGSSNFFDNTTGGALVLSNNMALPNGSPTFVGTNNLTLGNLNISAANRTLTVSNNKLSVNNLTETTGPWNLTKAGAGTLEVRGTDSHTGTAVVNGGTWLIPGGGNMTSASSITVSNTGSKLQVDGAISSPGAITINSGGTLAGTGSVSGGVTVNSGGKLSPGASPESLAVGALSLMAGSTFIYEINSSLSFAAGADLVNVALTGNTLIDTTGAGVTLSVSDLAATPVVYANKFTLMSYDATKTPIGTFAGRPEGSLVTIGVTDYSIHYADMAPGVNFDAPIAGSGFNYVTLTAVPEARAFILVGLVCVVIGAARIFGGRRLQTS